MRARVLTFNLWVDEDPQRRLDAFIEQAAALDPDVMLLQEVREAEGLPLASRQICERLRLPGHAFGEMTPPGAPKRQGVAIVARFPLHDVRALPLPHRHEKVLGYCLLSARVRLGDRALGLHTTHLYWEPKQHARRADQMRAAIAAIDAYPCEAHVLGGDFNAAPDEPALAAAHARMLDTYARCNPGAPGWTWLSSNPHARRTGAAHQIPLDRRIDHLLCSPIVLGGVSEVRSSRVVFDAPVGGVWLSDHAGVLSELELDLPAPPQA